MLFSSNLFLFLFLPAVLLLYYLLHPRFRNYVLLISSLLFYAWGEPTFVLIMMSSILFNYIMALLVYHCRTKKLFLILAVAVNLGILFVYKYLDFFIENMNHLGFDLPLQNIALPLGISFFTFQAMSYVIDVYRGTAQVQRNPANVALYVAFFPQLVAGPIVRYQTIADQIHARHENINDFSDGVKRFIIGFSKKIILSNNMALVADAVFSMGKNQSSVMLAWMGALAYTFQIFFDFSGYSDMAIGLGKMFGFHFLENFDYPYISKSVSEFWRRWHISLGQWFRDYVYFPLGGSRVTSKRRLVLNLFVVWSLTGIWHGASWNFIVWGLLYFVILTFEKLSGYPGKFRHSYARGMYQVFSMLCVIIGWVFFRATNITNALHFCASMFALTDVPFVDPMVIRYFTDYRWFFLGAAVFSSPLPRIALQRILVRWPKLRIAVETLSVATYSFLLMWSVSFIMIGSHNPFIYFNF